MNVRDKISILEEVRPESEGGIQVTCHLDAGVEIEPEFGIRISEYSYLLPQLADMVGSEELALDSRRFIIHIVPVHILLNLVGRHHYALTTN